MNRNNLILVIVVFCILLGAIALWVLKDRYSSAIIPEYNTAQAQRNSGSDIQEGNNSSPDAHSPSQHDEKKSNSATITVPSETDSRDTVPGTGTPEIETPPFTITNPRPITDKKDFMAPRWSPDGLDILVTGPKYSGLYLVSPDGTDLRQLSAKPGIGYNVQWSPDGTYLIIEEDGKVIKIDLTGEETALDEEYQLEQAPVYANNDNIYAADPESGEKIPLTSGEDSYYAPDISPNQTKIAYNGLTTGIHVQDIETGETVSVGHGNHVQWMPDGSGIVFDRTQDDGQRILSGDIYYAATDGSGVYQITDTPGVIEQFPRVSPDGTRILYEVDGQIFIADIDEVID